MNINSVKLVYFSPTGTTRAIVESVAEGINVSKTEHLNLTPPEAESRGLEEIGDGLTIIGVPVYDSRVPVDAIHRLRRIKADKTPAVVIVVYGNRAYDDALLELNNLAIETGFNTIAAGAFIGEHALLPIADGRPDTGDLRKAREFGRMIWENIKTLKKSTASPPKIPGEFPYRGSKGGMLGV